MMLQFQMMLQLRLSVKLLVNDAAFAIVMLLQLKLSMLLQLFNISVTAVEVFNLNVAAVAVINAVAVALITH